MSGHYVQPQLGFNQTSANFGWPLPCVLAFYRLITPCLKCILYKSSETTSHQHLLATLSITSMLKFPLITLFYTILPEYLCFHFFANPCYLHNIIITLEKITPFWLAKSSAVQVQITNEDFRSQYEEPQRPLMAADGQRGMLKMAEVHPKPSEDHPMTSEDFRRLPEDFWRSTEDFQRLLKIYEDHPKITFQRFFNSIRRFVKPFGNFTKGKGSSV